MAGLEARQLSLAYDKKVVVTELDFTVPANKLTALVGPNGSGKSTVLKGLARVLAPLHGAAYLDNKAIHQEPTKQIARQLAILPQTPRAPAGLTVREVVRFGRYPYRKTFGGSTATDEAAIQKAIERVGLTELRDRPLNQLSGGQAQRVWIAMALAQETKYLLLDEPTTYLDIAHQVDILDLLRKLNRSSQLTVVMATQDINLAARYSDYIVALRDGKIVATGSPTEFMSEEVIESVFNIKVDIVRTPQSEIPVFIPRSLGASHDVQ